MIDKYRLYSFIIPCHHTLTFPMIDVLIGYIYFTQFSFKKSRISSGVNPRSFASIISLAHSQSMILVSSWDRGAIIHTPPLFGNPAIIAKKNLLP